MTIDQSANLRSEFYMNSPQRDIQLSLVIPVYNRPIEVEELLASLSTQTHQSFEVVIVEDGSTEKCDEVVRRYQSKLEINYYFKENSGPGQSRNYGCERAKGSYFVILDSDCIIPPQFVETVYSNLRKNYVDAFGGPDKAEDSFTPLQKAINYAMTSFLTTGGIRGGSQKLDRFYPRSFNMGFSKEVFQKTGGFPSVRYAASKAAGEDIEFSQNIYKAGFSINLMKEAYVFHKRRTSIKAFYRQVYNFGYARISLFKRDKSNLKAVHFFPSVFLVGTLLLMAGAVFVSKWLLLPFLFLIIVLFVDALAKTKSVYIALMSVCMSFIQLIGYGLGFLVSFWQQVILGKSLNSKA